MPVPDYYKRYEKIAKRLGFTLDVSPKPNSMRDNFTLTDPLADTALTLQSDDGEALLDFLNTNHFARMDARITELDGKIGAMDGRLRTLERGHREARRQPMGDAEMYENIERLDQECAIPAGGKLEIVKVQEVVRVTYWRNSELHLNTVFSSAMLRDPFHSGQNHHFHFELPRDYDVLCKMLEHDLGIVKKQSAENQDTGDQNH